MGATTGGFERLCGCLRRGLGGAAAAGGGGGDVIGLAAGKLVTKLETAGEFLMLVRKKDSQKDSTQV